MKVGIYRTKLVREASATYKFEQVTTPHAARRVAIQLLGETLVDAPQEEFWVLTLDTKLKVTGMHHISTGTVDSTLVHPREVFRAALLDSASFIITVHNHPSGDTTPSNMDRSMWKALEQAGDVLRIAVADHLIIGVGNEGPICYSYRENSSQ
jgi:DNA repair protein RadC